MTDTERLLWRHFGIESSAAGNSSGNIRWGHFIVDFICVEKNVIIEVDGGQHAENEELDLQRSALLK